MKLLNSTHFKSYGLGFIILSIVSGQSFADVDTGDIPGPPGPPAASQKEGATKVPAGNPNPIQPKSATEVKASPLGQVVDKANTNLNNAGNGLNADPFNPAKIQNYQNAVQGVQTGMKALEKKYEDQMTPEQMTLLRYMMASQVNQNLGGGQKDSGGSKSSSSSSSSSTPKAANIPQGIGPVGQISIPKVSDVNILNQNPPAAPLQPRGETQVLQTSDGKKVPVTIVDSLDPSPSAPSVDTSKPPEAFGLRTFISEPINRSSSTLTLDDSVQKATSPHADSADRGVASTYVGSASVPRADGASSTKASSAVSAKMKEKLAKLLAKNTGKNATGEAAGTSALPAGSGSPEAARGLVVYSGKSGEAGGAPSEDAFSEFNGNSRPGRYRTANPKGDRMGPDVRKRGLASLDSVKSLWNDGYDGNRWILIGLAGLVALLAAGKKVTGDRRSRVRVSSQSKK